jgi:hypothetical protein
VKLHGSVNIWEFFIGLINALFLQTGT